MAFLDLSARTPRRVQCSARKEGLMFKTIFAATAALVITAMPAQAQTCTRDGLKAIVANYFKAVETHNMSALETAPNLRITQNGSEIKLGEGFFKTGGKSQFQRTLIDTERCGTLTQAVIDETPDPNAPAPAGRGGGTRGAAGPRGRRRRWWRRAWCPDPEVPAAEVGTRALLQRHWSRCHSCSATQSRQRQGQ